MFGYRIVPSLPFLLGFAIMACSKKNAEPPPSPPTLVEVARAESGALAIDRVYLGQVRSSARAELAASASGEVVAILVREGDAVKKGDVLIRIDPELARARLSAASAARNQADTELTQASSEAEQFAEAGIETVAKLEIDRAAANAASLKSKRENLRASEDEARAVLSRHRIVAPFDGVVAKRQVDVGDWISEGSPALELVSLDNVEILATVELALLTDLREGMTVTLEREGMSAEGIVAGVVQAADPQSRGAQIRIEVKNRPIWLIPGSTVDVRLRVERAETREGSVLVPRSAVLTDVAQNRVYKVDGDKAVAVAVDVLDRGPTQTRVAGEGLKSGDTVIIAGNDRLRSGQAVRIEAP
ncbi:MAG: efflux RND transporter periplasmic adaptor subunit [Polyangiales bacterium]